MATVSIDSEELRQIMQRLSKLEASNRELVSEVEKTKQDIAQIRLEVGGLRSNAT